MRKLKEYPFEQGEVWATAIDIRYHILKINGASMEVEKLPHPSSPGVKAILKPERVSLKCTDFERRVVRNVTEDTAA